MALLSIPLGFASLHYEQGQPISLANDLQLFTFRWQSLFRIGWQWTRYPMYNSIYAINEFIETNRFFFTDKTYVKINNYFEVARDLSEALASAVMAIYSADDQDAITDVYDLTYQQDIHCNAHFVRMMMTAFKAADNHPAYEDFAEKYEIHEGLRNEIIGLIDSKRDVAI